MSSAVEVVDVPNPSWRSSPDAVMPVVIASPLVPFGIVGLVAIVLGGFVAAVTRPIGWSHGSWVAAFLVLVVGVGQIGLAVGQAAICRPGPSSRTRLAELLALNLGAAIVVAGTLLSAPVIVTLGSAFFAIALGLFARALAKAQGTGRVRVAVLVLLLGLLVSVPIGTLLSWLRA